jgi:hypothetical protein
MTTESQPEFRPAETPFDNIGMVQVTHHPGGVRQFGPPTPEFWARTIGKARNRDVLCRYLITHPELVAQFVEERRYGELADLVDFINDGIDGAYALSDPYHFRQLCRGVAEFYCNGWGSLNAEKLRQAQERDDAEALKSQGRPSDELPPT